MKLARRNPAALPLAAGLLAAALAGHAQQKTAALTDLSLEQLSNIEVTTVGKRVQRLAEVPGSVYIITQEDIRRSGATSLPEVLRLAPNLQVARADANQYAISARGFNSVIANKMLVLVDGRTAYSPLFSGVFWEAQDLVLEDVERIEVLSGAGGTLYGSNAVNGVISIITRSAADTGGVLASAAAGNRERVALARYGHAAEGGGAGWRIYGKRVENEPSQLANGAAVRDRSSRNQAGFRTDHGDAERQLTVQGDVYQGRIDMAPAARSISGANLLGRYTAALGDGQAQLQAFYDRAERRQPGAINDTLDTWDLEFQHVLQPAAAHELIWGAGYRLMDDRLSNLSPAVFAFRPADRLLHLGNVFVQDEFAVSERLHLTAGAKAEHNSYTGLEFLPNVRAAWEMAPRQLLWGALSRTVRTPSRVDRELFSVASTAGGTDFVSEVARVAEVGWRGQPHSAVTFSVTAFHHGFDRLRSVDLLPGGATALRNNYQGRLWGVEGWGRWRVDDRLRLDASFAWQRLRLDALSTTAPGFGTSQLGNDPGHRFGLGATWDLAPRMELDVQLRHVGGLPDPPVPSYTAVDARWGWRVRPGLELSLVARNLTDARHPEWGAAASRIEFKRSLLLMAVWRL